MCLFVYLFITYYTYGIWLIYLFFPNALIYFKFVYRSLYSFSGGVRPFMFVQRFVLSLFLNFKTLSDVSQPSPNCPIYVALTDMKFLSLHMSGITSSQRCRASCTCTSRKVHFRYTARRGRPPTETKKFHKDDVWFQWTMTILHVSYIYYLRLTKKLSTLLRHGRQHSALAELL